MDFKNLASKIIDDVSGIKSTETSKNEDIKDILEGLDLNFDETVSKDLSEDFDLDIEDETPEENSQKVEQLFDGYLGEKNFAPNPLEYGPNAMYRQNGTVYRKSVDNLWEAYLKDGSPGARGAAGGSGTGVQEVQKIIENEAPYNKDSYNNVIFDENIYGNTTQYIDLMSYSPPEDGITPADKIFASAVSAANSTGKTILLPPFPIVLVSAFKLNKIQGISGKSKIIISDNYILGGWPPGVWWRNVNFSTHYDEDTADEIYMKDFTIESKGKTNFVQQMFGNVKHGIIEGVTYINNTNTPPIGNQLLDLYSCCKNMIIRNNTFIQKCSDTIAGMCMSVRNVGAGTSTDITENILVEHNYFHHEGGDEALAVYGVHGLTQNVVIRNNKFYLPLNDLNCLNRMVITTFPCDDGSIHGVSAAVKNVSIENNEIFTSATDVGPVIRLGDGGRDSDNIQRNLTSRNNVIYYYRNSIWHDLWVSAGSSGTDPDTKNIIIRHVPQSIPELGTSSLPLDQFIRSYNDTIYFTGPQKSNAGFYGAKLNDCKVLGNVSNATAYCDINGGVYQSNEAVHLQPRKVINCEVSGSTGIFYLNANNGIIIENVNANVSDYFVYTVANTSSDNIRIKRNIVTQTGSSNPSIRLATKLGVTNIEIDENDVSGSFPSMYGSFGTTIHRGNRYNGIKVQDINTVVCTSSYDVHINDDVIILSGTSILSAFLPKPEIGKEYIIKRTDSNTTAHVISAKTSTIDGSTSFIFSSAYQSIRLKYIATNIFSII